jgi:hypothetical protein
MLPTLLIAFHQSSPNQTQLHLLSYKLLLSFKNGLQCPWQLTLWHHVVNSSRQAISFFTRVPFILMVKSASSTLMSLYQCVSFGPARRYRFPFLEDKPAIHQA